MKVAELIERLTQFPRNAIVVIGNSISGDDRIEYAPARNVCIGCNEFDDIVFIDDYEEEEGKENG